MALDSAAKTALTTNAPDTVIYDTIELHHSLFDYLLVAGFNSLSNGGKSYLPYAFEVALPPIEPNTGGELKVSLDNSKRSIPTYILQALQTNEPIELWFRQHVIGTGVNSIIQATLPMYVRGASENDSTIEITAGYVDVLNMQFPSENYDVSRFPGMGL